jgi:hypothetical protein
LAGETEVFGENLPQRHFVYHKSHLTRPGIEFGPPRWKASDYPLELWRGLFPNLIEIRSVFPEMTTLNILADKRDEQTQPLQSALFLCTYCSYYAERVGGKMVEGKQRSCL